MTKPPQKRFSIITSQRPAATRGRLMAGGGPTTAVLPHVPTRAAVTLRLLQKMPDKGRGLAIGYGFPEDLSLPGWALVLSGDAPGRIDIPAARRLAGVSAGVPLLLMGDRGGVQTVFRAFIANQTEDVTGAAFFGGDYPADAYSLSLWVHLAERSAEGKGLRLLTDLSKPDAALAAILGASQAPAGAKEETPAARLARLMASTFGPMSKPMPSPVPPVEHFTPPAE